MKRAEFDRLVGKLQLSTRSGDHLFAWLEVDGKVIVRTRRSNKQGDLPMEHSIRQQLKLSQDQLAKLIACTMGRDAYLDLLRQKHLL